VAVKVTTLLGPLCADPNGLAALRQQALAFQTM